MADIASLRMERCPAKFNWEVIEWEIVENAARPLRRRGAAPRTGQPPARCGSGALEYVWADRDHDLVVDTSSPSGNREGSGSGLDRAPHREHEGIHLR